MNKKITWKIKGNVTREQIEKVTKDLLRNMGEINEIMSRFNIPEVILEREIKQFGNASHIILPKEFANKKAKVIIEK